MKSFYLLLSFLVLTSCATVDTGYKGADAGYAVISLSLDFDDGLFADENNFENFELIFANDNASTAEDIKNFYSSKVGFGSPEPDIKDKKSQTFVITRPLQPGKYSIFSFRLVKGGNTVITLSPKVGFSIPFEIKPNEYNYLGNYHGVAVSEKNFLGLSGIASGYIIVTDHKDRDIKLARVANPLLKMDLVTSSVPNVESISNPLFVRERITAANAR